MRKPDAGVLDTLGWREWAALPDLGVPRIKVKVDTGARTSSIHAFAIERSGGRVRFGLHALQKSGQEIWCETAVVDERYVTDSGGHSELRPFILTAVTVGRDTWPVELSLTARDSMRFRMLLGRLALEGRYLVDPSASFTKGKRRFDR
ncbi:MAG TPA: RimK/LysX family protein [Solimonas sp.]|nr:RimK/LysX family protein [Solimonas sp.]